MKSTMLLSIPTLIAICGMPFAAVAVPPPDVTFTPIALTGQQAPGQAAGVTFRFFSDARLNSAGQVAFWAELGGPGITAVNDGSIWLSGGRNLQLVVREADPVPGLVDTVFAAFPRHGFNDAGVLAFPGILVPSNQTSVPINVAIFVKDAQGIQMLAREGEPAAGLPAAVPYAGFAALSLTPTGEVIWQGNAGFAAWEASATSPADAIAVRNEPAPGAGAANFEYVDLPGTAAAGTPVFRSTTREGTTLGMGLWTAASGTPALIVLAGQQAPGAPAGVTLDHLSMGPVSCASDCVAFWSRLSGAGVSTDNDGALFTGSASAPTLLVREGSAAAGTTGDFGTISPQVAINSAGMIAFGATLTGAGVSTANNSAIYVATGSSAQLAAREGDAAPGLAAGIEFANFDSPILNSAGEVAFIAHLRNGGVTPTSNRALYFRSADGTLTPLVQTGALFETGSGERTIEEIVIDHDPAAAGGGGHSAFTTTPSGTVLAIKLHFKDPGPNNTVLRASGLFAITLGGSCYANCDGSTVEPVLNVADFSCFLGKFAAADPYANCDGSTVEPVLNVADFSCFLGKFAAGCK